MEKFTVISIEGSSCSVYMDHVYAANGLHAFAVAATMRCTSDDDDNGSPIDFIAAIKGHLTEADDMITFAGEGLVDGLTVLEQTDVFGPK